MEITPHLTPAELATAKFKAASLLLKIKSFDNEILALVYIEHVLADFSNDAYKNKFLTIYHALEDKKRSPALQVIFKRMTLKKSILNYFSSLNYQKSPLRDAIHNARAVFQSSQYNAKTIIK